MPQRQRKTMEEREKEYLGRLDDVLLSTGNIDRKYYVRDVVFVTDRIEADLFDDSRDPNQLFANVILQLKKKALENGADAVINVRFDQTSVMIDGSRYLEILAYGTVVQLLQTTISG